MGLVYTDIELANAANSALLPMTVRALVDKDCQYFCLPAEIGDQLQLTTIDVRTFALNPSPSGRGLGEGDLGLSGVEHSPSPSHLRFAAAGPSLSRWERERSGGFDYAGPLHVRLADRQMFCGALIGSDQVVLGAMAMAALNIGAEVNSLSFNPNIVDMPTIYGGKSTRVSERNLH